MALCDQLEQQQKHRDNLRTSTRKSAIDAISTATTPEELEAAWKRINNNWEVISDTPESVQSLRGLILDLAINGLISSSDTSSWRMTTLGDEVQIVRGITFPSSAKGRIPGRGLLPCLRTANIQNEIDWDDLLYVSEDFVRNDDQYVQLNDLLISMANSRELVGKVALVRRNDIRCTLGGFIAAIRCGAGIHPKYLMTILRVPSAREKLIDSSTQTTNIANISLGRLRPFVLTLPPLSEQQVIVAKVDELMALCDQLESELKVRSEVAEKFARSVVNAA
jgi:restriction endonuclease S subunit